MTDGFSSVKISSGVIWSAEQIRRIVSIQVEEIKNAEQPSIVINNANTNSNVNNNTNLNAAMFGIRAKNKWVAFLLCLFLGYLGAHKFYEGKVGMGLLYLFTFGLFGIGWVIDCIALLFKPNPYYVR